MQIHNDTGINFKANKILTAQIGKKQIMDVYKLNPKEDFEFAKDLFSSIASTKEQTPVLKELKTFLASFITEFRLNSKNSKTKMADYYFGHSKTNGIEFGYKLDNNMDNFVTLDNYIRPKGDISIVTLVRSAYDEVLKNTQKALISDPFKIIKRDKIQTFINMTNDTTEKQLHFKGNNNKVDLYSIFLKK